MYIVPVDHNLRENIQYKDFSFPFGVWIDEYASLVDHTLNCHWHRDIEFDMVLEGAVDFYLNGIKFPLTAGECLFINSDTLHMATQHQSTTNARVLVVTFRTELFSKDYSESAFLEYFNNGADGFKWDSLSAEGHAVKRLFEDILNTDTSEYGYELRYLSAISMIWYYTARYIKSNPFIQQSQKSNHNSAVKKILSYIHEHFHEKITIEDLFEYANISRSECFQCFKQYTDTSPINYINDYRLSKAAVQLADTDQSITEICFACGFTNTSYFVKLFRSKYGISPLKYRKKLSHSFTLTV